jgi:RNA recognition motif-containing protein
MVRASAIAEPASESSGRPKENHMAAKLYVGGLSYSTTSETLREYFAQCGTVESASVVTDKFSGQSRGFGFVEMATTEEAQRAISELNGKELDGRKLTVNVSNPRPAGGGGGGPRGGGGRGGRPGGGGRGPGGGGGDRGAYGVPPSKKPFRW